MTKRRNTRTTFRMRSDEQRMNVWRRASKKNGLNLSDFARRSMDAAALELVDLASLDYRLCKVREAINAAQHVRTEQHRNERLDRALTIVNEMIRRTPNA